MKGTRADLVVVGAGLFGLTVAERAATQLGWHVVVLEKRGHVGGNCFSEWEQGIEIHRYGAHIFHTDDRRVWDYVRGLGEFNGYEHQVWTQHEGQTYPMPINLGTINGFFRAAMSPAEARELIGRQVAEARAAMSPAEARELIGRQAEGAGVVQARNFEEKAISLIGRPLYEAFIRGYTLKQWETDPRELPAGVIERLPVRYNYDNRYFSDRFQGIPLDGYGALLGKLAADERIEVRLNTEFEPAAESGAEGAAEGAAEFRGVPMVYTGPIDRFFGYRLGKLGWRTVDFEYEWLEGCADFQGCAVMNYADPVPKFTRILEFKHFHPEREGREGPGREESGRTVIAREFSRAAGDGDEPYYPVDTEADRRLLARYRELARATAPEVIFAGRLGDYRYYDMDDTIAAALDLFDELSARR